MKVFAVRRILAVSATACLLLAGCGSESSAAADLDDIAVKGSDSPKLSVGQDFSTESTEMRIVTKGDGDEVADGDSVKVNYVAVNGRTGKQFDNSFTSKSPLTVTLDDKSALPGFVKALSGQAVGSRVLVAIPPKDGFGQARAELGIKADDTMVFLFDIVAKVPDKASGEAKRLPKDVPSIVEKDDHPASFKATRSTPDKVSKPRAHVAIEGDGPAVKDGQSLSIHYVGQVYPDGEIFDSSWDRGTPATLGLDQVIACWQDLIPGQKVGSRVVLVCPADTAYGDKPQPGSPIKPGDTLMFAIDLLDAS
ncbi:MAG: FKBP-type peptidyl-prolyl cis-trans isomerase [Aeromicrobium sp.]